MSWHSRKDLLNEATRTRINHEETTKSRTCKYCGRRGLHWNHNGVRWTLLYSDGRVHSCQSHSQKDYSQMKSSRQQNRELHGDTSKVQIPDTIHIGDQEVHAGDKIIVIGETGDVKIGFVEHDRKAVEVTVNTAVEVVPPKPTTHNLAEDQVKILTFNMSLGLVNEPLLQAALQAGDYIVLAMVDNKVDPQAIGCFIANPDGRFEIDGLRFSQVGWVPRSMGAGKHVLWNLLKGHLDVRGVVREIKGAVAQRAIIVTAYFQQ